MTLAGRQAGTTTRPHTCPVPIDPARSGDCDLRIPSSWQEIPLKDPMITAGDTGPTAQRSVSPQIQSSGMTRQPQLTGTAEDTSADLQGDTMNTTLTAICSIPGAGRVITARRANARLAPGGRDGPRERDTPVGDTPPAGQAARSQLILDLLDPEKRRGAWSPAASPPVRDRNTSSRLGRWVDTSRPRARRRPGGG